jgi:uncharacterized protein (DUF2062 family)
MNPRRWLHEHSLKLLAIRDTPEAIAGGVAIGMYFAFAPLFGFKTLLAVFLAWVTRCNVLAAVLAVMLHEIIFFLMPLIYWWEYALGHWLLSSPHEWPRALAGFDFHHLHVRKLWENLLSAGRPLLVGGCLLPLPLAGVSYVITRPLVSRHQRKKQLEEEKKAEEEQNPS